MKWLRKFWPYVLITFSFFVYLFIFHPKIFSYKMPQTLVHDYLRSQDIEDPKGLIHDRIFLSDSDIYIASGYLYATGVDPSSLNLHPPLMKYLFGFSTLLTSNPFYIQILFGLALLILTYLLGKKLSGGHLVGLGAMFLLLIDPVFGGMMDGALLDLGQTVFALGYVMLAFFFPENWIWQGVLLGLFASSKFWSTAVVFVVLIYGYKLFIQKEKIDWKKILGSFVTALLIFSLTYIVSFVNAGGLFNIFAYQGRVLKFMLSHNSAVMIGGPVILFITGYFTSWWKAGVVKASDWSLLWPIGLLVGVVVGVKNLWRKAYSIKLFIYLLPFTFLLLSLTQVPFTRYFLIILPFVYVGFVSLLAQWYHSFHVQRKNN